MYFQAKSFSIELGPSTLLTANPGGDGGDEEGADGYSGGGGDCSGCIAGGNGGTGEQFNTLKKSTKIILKIIKKNTLKRRCVSTSDFLILSLIF